MTTTAEKTNIEIVCAGIIVADVFLPPIDKLPDEGELIKIDEPAHHGRLRFQHCDCIIKTR